MAITEFKPLINGREYGWGDISISIGGVPIVGIRAVEYKEEQQKENIYGAGRNPVSRGYGRVKTSASVTLLSSTVFQLQSQAPNGKLHEIAPFDIVVAYQPSNGPLVLKHIKNCEFMETNMTWSEGDLSKDIKLELIPSHIVNKS